MPSAIEYTAAPAVVPSAAAAPPPAPPIDPMEQNNLEVHLRTKYGMSQDLAQRYAANVVVYQNNDYNRNLLAESRARYPFRTPESSQVMDPKFVEPPRGLAAGEQMKMKTGQWVDDRGNPWESPPLPSPPVAAPPPQTHEDAARAAYAALLEQQRQRQQAAPPPAPIDPSVVAYLQRGGR